MKNIKTRKIILTIMLIVKDVIMWTIRCLIATILISVCVKNGWFLSNRAINISYNDFWELYSVIYVFVPIIMMYRGITGSYKVEVCQCSDEQIASQRAEELNRGTSEGEESL